MFKLFVLIVLLSALVLADQYEPVEVEQCSEGIKPTNVRSQYCSAVPCTFVQGGPIGFEMDFVSPIDTETLTVTAKAQIGILNMEYRIPAEHQDGCVTLIKGTCPLRINDTVTYEMDMILNAPATNVEPIIRVTLRDDNQKPIVCFGIKTHIAKE